LITKDADFKDSHFLQNTPKKLLKISLGNIPTSDLLELLQTHLVLIQAKNELSKFFIEINPDRLWIIE
jgi:predicted nuclease of predicted toxin-antitoxin system